MGFRSILPSSTFGNRADGWTCADSDTGVSQGTTHGESAIYNVISFDVGRCPSRDRWPLLGLSGSWIILRNGLNLEGQRPFNEDNDWNEEG